MRSCHDELPETQKASSIQLRLQPKTTAKDYSQNGAYFCTICVHKAHRKKNVFGRVDDVGMHLNSFGCIVEECWFDIPNHRISVPLDEFSIMPNHVHCVLILEDDLLGSGASSEVSLGNVIGAFKAAAKREINLARGELTLVWQRGFYDRVVRSEAELLNIRRYIENNPANWANDRCHPQHPRFEEAWLGYSPDADL